MTFARALSIALFFLGFMAMPAAAAGPGYEPADAALLSECLLKANAAGTNPEPSDSARAIDCIGVAASACEEATEGGYSTVGMADCTDRETAWWDEALNKNYSSIREKIDPESFAALRDAQRAWISFRDKSCAFEYKYWEEGTIRTTFYTTCMLSITARRALDLQEILTWMSN